MRRAATFIAVLCLLAAPIANAAPTFKLQGQLRSAAGIPAPDGSYGMTISVYAAEDSVDALYSDVDPAVVVSNGVFEVTIGSITPLNTALFADGTAAWVGIQIGAEPELPRSELQWVPYAVHAMTADGLGCTGCVTASHLDPSILADFIQGGSLAKVAESGSYADLLNTPDLSVYAMATDLPDLSPYAKLTDLPAPPDLSPYAKLADLATVATTGKYTDLLDQPVLAKLGEQCGAGEAMRGLKADGSPDCVATDLEGDLDMEGNKILDLGAPTDATDAATKGYVDTTAATVGAGLPGLSGNKTSFTVVFAMRDSGTCPTGFTTENFFQVQGSDNLLRILIMDGGLFFGGKDNDGGGNGNEYNYARINAGQGVTKICWRTYNSSSGRARMSFLASANSGAGKCPTGYAYHPKSNFIAGSQTAYLQTTSAGAYFGYIDNWGRDAQAYAGGGYTYRYFSDQADGICWRVTGVDEHPDTARGTYPALLGLQSVADCPAGWFARSTSEVDGANQWFYYSVADHLTALGGLNSWSWGGDNYLAIQFQPTQAAAICFREFDIVEHPRYVVRTPASGDCPAGYLSLNAGTTKNGSTGYIATTGFGFFLGGLQNWWVTDHRHGFMQASYSSTATNKVCLRFDGVE